VTVSGWEIGKRMPEPQMLPRIAGVFGTTVDNLLGHSTRADSIRVGEVIFVPIYGSVAVKEGRLAFLDYHGTYPVPAEAATVPRGVQAVLLSAPDTSMALAGIALGAQVLVHVNAKVRPGDLCMTVINGDRPCLRICCQVTSDTITLKTADPALPPETYNIDECHFVGPCVAQFQMLPRGPDTD
jgi:SOS-response transcriptional repressor LexA